ncbi:MAG: efflux RND transporter periplasmic adaptor subunit [Caulobacterales bacterium]
MIRKHFFLAGAILVLGLMLIAGGLRLLAGHGGGDQSGQPGGGPAAGPGGAPGGGPPRGTTVTPAVVASRNFTDHIEVLGVAKGRQSVVITSNTTELVTGVHFRDGEPVRKGQVLVDLKATEQDAGVIQSKAALDLAKLDYNRWQTLADRGIAPKATADQYRIAYEQAKANLAVAESRRSDRVIRAPFAGVAGLTDIAPGALINPGAPVVSLDDISVMRVDFNIPDRYLPVLAPGQTITATADAYPNQVFHGVIAKFDTRIDEKTRSIKARAEFPNTGAKLKPGMLMRVSIDQGQRTALAAPEAAVQFNADQAYVYLIVRDGARTVARQQPVTPGADQAGYFEIKDGLSAGQVIVADGVNRVSPNQPVSVQGGARPGARTVAQNAAGPS